MGDETQDDKLAFAIYHALGEFHTRDEDWLRWTGKHSDPSCNLDADDRETYMPAAKAARAAVLAEFATKQPGAILDTATLDSIYSMAQIVEGVAQGTNLAKYHAGLEAVQAAVLAELAARSEAGMPGDEAGRIAADAFGPHFITATPHLNAAAVAVRDAVALPLLAALELERSAREADRAALRALVKSLGNGLADNPADHSAECVSCAATFVSGEDTTIPHWHEPDCAWVAAILALKLDLAAEPGQEQTKP